MNFNCVLVSVWQHGCLLFPCSPLLKHWLLGGMAVCNTPAPSGFTEFCVQKCLKWFVSSPKVSLTELSTTINHYHHCKNAVHPFRRVSQSCQHPLKPFWRSVEQHLTKTLHVAMSLYLTPQSLQRVSDDHLTLVLRLVEGSEEKKKMCENRMLLLLP